jgi:hypothetical protein
MNKGLRALKKESPEAYNKIMGKMAMDGMKNMMGMGGVNEYGMGGKNMYKGKLAEMGMKVMKDYGMGGKMYDNGGEVPGVDKTSRDTQIGFNVEGQRPIMGDADQIFIDGLPVSGKELKAYLEEMSEGMKGQGGMGVADALMAIDARRKREMHGRDRLGPGMYRPTSNEELASAQKAAGVKALMDRLDSYSSRSNRDY